MYTDLLNEDSINSQYLAIIKPRRILKDNWVLVSGSIYKQSFDYGLVYSVELNNIFLDKDTTSAIVSNEWYYNDDDKELYVNIGSDPNGETFIITYSLFFGTFDSYFYSDPLNIPSSIVYYEPLITKSPEISATNSDLLFGFLPSQTTQITFSNLTQYFYKHLYDSSFNKADIDIFHYINDLTIDNIKRVTGGVCGSVQTTDESVAITIYDNNSIYDEEFRHSGDTSFYAESDFPNLNPDFQARPIRKVYGVVDKFIPVNIDFNSTAPSNLNNRIYSCYLPFGATASVSRSVLASPASTATRTYLNTANGIRVGDSVWIDSSLGAGFDEYVLVTAVNKSGSHYIEHASITNIAVSGDVVKRSVVGNVKLVKDNSVYDLLYGKHYIDYVHGSPTVEGFELLTTLESDLSISAINPINDLIYCRIYGEQNGFFGGDSTETGSMTLGVTIIYDLLVNHLKIDPLLIGTSFNNLVSGGVVDEIGFAIPKQINQDFPTYKTLVSEICASLLLKIFLDTDLLISVSQLAPFSTEDYTIQDDEILKDSFTYNFDYTDIKSDIIVEYEPKEISSRNETGDIYYKRVRSSSDNAKLLHKVNKQQTFQSLHFKETEAQKLCDRISYILGERRGSIAIQAKNRFLISLINDTIKIQKDRMAGYEYIKDTLRDRKGSLVAYQRKIDEISLMYDDQKGIEDNQSLW